MNNKLDFEGAWPFCTNCRNADIETITFRGETKPYFTARRCANEFICRHTIDQYKKMVEERKDRPYDAMGDDIGSGGFKLNPAAEGEIVRSINRTLEYIGRNKRPRTR